MLRVPAELEPIKPEPSPDDLAFDVSFLVIDPPEALLAAQDAYLETADRVRIEWVGDEVELEAELALVKAEMMSDRRAAPRRGGLGPTPSTPRRTLGRR